jgi:bifunctional DNase/RNase
LRKQPASPANSEQVTIADVQVRISDHGAVVLLLAEGKAIPIFVDLTVALSIQGALNGEKLSRPLSRFDAYDLGRLWREVVRTVITLKGGTYYGALTVAMQDQVKTFDSRSSDSIALAVHFKAPIVVGRDLLESAGALWKSRRRKICKAYSFSIRTRSRSRRFSVDFLMKDIFSPRCCSALIFPRAASAGLARIVRSRGRLPGSTISRLPHLWFVWRRGTCRRVDRRLQHGTPRRGRG